MGVFVNAVDAKTGRTKWSNREVNRVNPVRLDHNDMQEAGLSPQGYFLFVDGKLQVPNGRSMPAGFDPHTGKLLHYVQGYRRGDSRVTASGKIMFVGEAGMVRTEDGREVGERWKAAGKEAPRSWSTPKLDLFEGPFFGYKFMPGCDFRSVFDRGIAYGMSKGFLHARDLNRAKTTLYEKTKGDHTYHPKKWDAPELWKRCWIAEGTDASTRCMIKAGSRLYIHVGQNIIVIDVAVEQGAQPEVVDKFKLDGTPASMIAADGKLFISLTDGRMLCWGKAPPSVMKHPRRHEPPATRKDSASERAARILKQPQVNAGYGLVLGVNDESLVEALLDQSALRVIAVDEDRSKVNALRQRLTDARLYGTRAEVYIGDPVTFHFPHYLADLIVRESVTGSEPLSHDDLTHLYSVLHPYGGVLWLGGKAKDRHHQEQQVAAAQLASAEVSRESEALLIRKVGPLPGSADWTHEGCDAGRTYCSRDDLVRAPLGILWYGDGPDHGFYKRKDYGRGVKPQVAGGRVFVFDDVRQLIGAVDAYTGRLLWTFTTGTDHVRFASRTDGVYVGRDQQCDLLDPATGKIQNTYPCRLQQQKGRTWGVVDIRVTDDLILVAFGYDLPEGHSHPTIELGLWDCDALVALDKKTGKQLWEKYPAQRFNIHAIAAGGGMVFVTDSIAPPKAARLDHRGTPGKTAPSITYALDAKTGKQDSLLQKVRRLQLCRGKQTPGVYQKQKRDVFRNPESGRAQSARHPFRLQQFTCCRGWFVERTMFFLWVCLQLPAANVICDAVHAGIGPMGEREASQVARFDGRRLDLQRVTRALHALPPESDVRGVRFPFKTLRNPLAVDYLFDQIERDVEVVVRGFEADARVRLREAVELTSVRNLVAQDVLDLPC